MRSIESLTEHQPEPVIGPAPEFPAPGNGSVAPRRGRPRKPPVLTPVEVQLREALAALSAAHKQIRRLKHIVEALPRAMRDVAR